MMRPDSARVSSPEIELGKGTTMGWHLGDGIGDQRKGKETASVQGISEDGADHIQEDSKKEVSMKTMQQYETLRLMMFRR